MNDLWEENKKGIITIGIILLLAIIFGVLTLLMNNGSKTSEKKLSSEKALNELGTMYYEKVYYPYIEKEYSEGYIKFLNNKSSVGIKVTLRQIQSSIKNVNTENFIDYKNKTICDYDLTYIIIRPNSPYGKKDYTIETKLDCDVKYSSNEKSGA